MERTSATYLEDLLLLLLLQSLVHDMCCRVEALKDSSGARKLVGLASCAVKTRDEMKLAGLASCEDKG